MQKIKLNISGNLVRVTIPKTTNFKEIEKQLREITIKNYKLLKTLKFYQLVDCDFKEDQNLSLEKIIETTVNLLSLTKGNTDKNRDEIIKEKVQEKKPYRIHYGTLRSGEKISCDENLIILGNTNPGSYAKSKKSVFVYGKAQGTLHAGSNENNTLNEKNVIYLEKAGTPKIRIGNIQRTYCNKEELRRLLFVNKFGEIHIEEKSKVEVDKILEKIGIDLI